MFAAQLPGPDTVAPAPTVYAMLNAAVCPLFATVQTTVAGDMAGALVVQLFKAMAGGVLTVIEYA